MLKLRIPRAFARAVVLAVTLSVLAPAGAAFASDEPTPTPSTSAPGGMATPEPTPSDEPSPVDEPTPTPTTEATQAPESYVVRQRPVPSATTTPSPTDGTLRYTGKFVRFSAEDGMTDDGTAILSVPGHGLLRVDPSSASQSIMAGGMFDVTLEAPIDRPLPADPEERFAALASYSTTIAPLKVVSAFAPTQGDVGALVNTTPNRPATHQVYAVLVSPSNKAKTANQTSARVSADVAHADDYWSEQSGGTIGFDLAGTVPWYASSHSCATVAGSVALWNQAMARAEDRLGYVATSDTHLVLFLPSNASCGGAIGFGTVGWSVNDWGLAWVKGQSGTDFSMERATLTRELGHNMSLGQASWLQCDSEWLFAPGQPGAEGCTHRDQGDTVDVMGPAMPGHDGGALSSANAIRAGIWDESAWTAAPHGISTHTINAVSSDAGLRAVIAQDRWGTNFFVEFRNFTDEDSQYAGAGCDTEVCAASEPGVRILRLANSSYVNEWGELRPGWQGIAGDDSQVISRRIDDVDVITYGVGETFTSWGDGTTWWDRVRVTVQEITADTATIEVEREFIWGDAGYDYVTLTTTDYYDDRFRVGDTATVFLSDRWNAESYEYVWLRDGLEFGAPSESSYVLTSADRGHTIAVEIRPTYAAGYGARIQSDAYWVYAAAGPYRGTGSVAVITNGGALAADLDQWPAGTTFKYQWYRRTLNGGEWSAISGATASSYAPTVADRARELRLRVTAAVQGYSLKTVRYSHSLDYTLYATGSVSIEGTAAVESPLTAAVDLEYSTPGAASIEGLGVAYQWLRSGVAISGADEGQYLPVAADLGAKISVRVTSTALGTTPHVTTSAGVEVAAATFSAVPTPAISQAGMVLTVDPADSTPTQTSRAYQWYRDGVAVTGKTAASYTLTQADFGKTITVKVTYKRTGYASVAKWAESSTGEHVWSVLASPPLPVIKNVDDGGTIEVGSTVKAHLPTYTDSQYAITLPDVEDGVRPKYQWYRNGTALAGKILPTYLVVEADKGQTLTVKVTAEHGLSRLVSNIATSTGVKIGSATIAGSQNATVTVEPNGSGVLEATVDGITETLPVTKKYQWYRDGSAVTGKTTAAYTLSSADQGKDVWVRVTISKAAIGSTTYTTVVRDSARIDYSISVDSSAPPFLWAPSAQVGNTMGVYDLNYETKDGFVVSPNITYQWLRNGSAIPGATASTYKLGAADYATTTGVKMTVRSAGYAPLVHTLKFETVIGKGVTIGMPEVEVVAAGLGKVKAQLVTGTLEPPYPTPTLTYQWYRDNPADGTPATKITDATSSTYTLTSADRGRELTVQVVMKRTNFTVPSMTLARPEETDYTIRAASGAAPTLSGDVAVGETLTATPPDYLEADGTTPLFATPTFTFTWYRSGTVIAGKTASTYVPTASDLGKKITVKVKASLPGRLAHTSAVSLPTAAVALGTLDLTGLTVTTFSNATIYPKVKADLTGTTGTPGLTYSYQWYRDTVMDAFDPAKITGATASSYALTNADTGKWVTLVITVKKTGYAPATFAPSHPANFIIEQGEATISGPYPNTGVTLTAVPPTFLTVDGRTITDYSIQWLVNEGDIPGATGDTFVVTSAENMQYISYLFTVGSPGHATISRMSQGVGGAG